MKTFRCDCGNNLYFENSQCLACGRAIGYLPDAQQLSALEPLAKNNWSALLNRKSYRQCSNYSQYQVCNWMVPNNDGNIFCVSCRLNNVIPNLNKPQNFMLWYRAEQAKRRLLYTLLSLNLSVIGRDQDPHKGLCFEFLQDDMQHGEFDNSWRESQHIVVTGHYSGKITINLREAEDSARIEMREKMNERYRTLLGHFRHESGHYYWEHLIHGTDKIDSFRELFGDERIDYQSALSNYYEHGAPAEWQKVWISPYASSHSWEDWAETWAHYLHMVDTVETAHDFNFSIHGSDISAAPSAGMQMSEGYFIPTVFDVLLDDWRRLSVALNALNRSMGMDDAYPFVICGTVLEKLQYVHQVILEASRQSPQSFFPNQTEAVD